MSISVFYTKQDEPKLHSEFLDASQEVKLEYLNEGGANFVFRIVPSVDDQELPSKLQGKLLRLRKDLPHVASAIGQLAAYNEHFKPLFQPENLVQFELIGLDEKFSTQLNAQLKGISRPHHRHHDFTPIQETYGLLVTDMTPKADDVLLQLKPKWLAQSPNAPPNAKRCRTCALRAKRASQQVRTATDAQQSCPLALISENATERERAVQGVTGDKLLQDYLTGPALHLLRKLRFCQSELDSCGVIDVEDPDAILNVCKAMTLRDCTLFLKRSGDRIEARFADLDLKLPEKISQWKKVEHSLIAEGWYANTENESSWTNEGICLLSRS